MTMMFGCIRSSKLRLFAVAAAGFVCAAVLVVDAFSVIPIHSNNANAATATVRAEHTRLFSSAISGGTAPVLKSLLKKPSKVLTVGVEYDPAGKAADDNLEVFSMKLRQQAKVSFIVCKDLNAIKLLSAEQETAKGNFPGPVPIVYYCDNDNEGGATATAAPEDVAAAGASAVVVEASESASGLAESVHSVGLETIWKVSTTEQAKQVLEWTDDQADVFWLDVDADDAITIDEIVQALPKSSMSIGVLREAMQADGAEIGQGKEFKSMGCASVVVKQACVGDKEDIEYASFVVSGLTSKASSEFKFSGLTGSTNGHFGGVQSNSSVRWERKVATTATASAEEESEDEE
eukprot:jgi/Psemu1/304612/fgenesh1_kg.163_\